MALVVADRVQETTATTGTGTITLAGAVSGFRSFATIGNGNTTYYCVTSGTAWEVGIGTYTSAGTTLARTTILASSAAGAAITLAGTSNVFCVYPAGKSIYQDDQGSVGIGTNAPLQFFSAYDCVTLEINTTAGHDTSLLRLYEPNNGVDFRLAATGPNSQALIGTYSAFPLVFYVDSAEAMRITTAGRLGIGTTSPATPLDVNGTITATTFSGAGSFTTLSASSTVSGTGFSTYLASPPAIGGTAAAAGTFTTLIANTSAGVGAIAPAGSNFYNAKNITGATSAYGNFTSATIQSDVTANARGYTSFLATAAASFSTAIQHFYAGQGTIGAGSTVNSQIGHYSETNLIGATNNYAFAAADTAAVTAGKTAFGFHSNVNTATGGGTTYAFYAAGTAPNVFTGTVNIGSNGAAGSNFYNAKTITGATTANGNATVATIQSGVTSSARGYATVLATAAASFTTTIQHFYANQGTIGAGSTVTSQFGYYSESNLIGGANNYAFYANNTAAVTAGKTATGFYSAVNTASGGGTAYAFYGAGTAPSVFTGTVNIGTTGSAGINFYNVKTITGATVSSANSTVATIQSDVTSQARGYNTFLATAASAFTLTQLYHYLATQGTIGAGSTVTSQFGFNSGGTLIGATNNYAFFAADTAAVTAGKQAFGFYSGVNTASGGGTAFGVYSAGTADNVFRGNVYFGNTGVTPAAKIHVAAGTATANTAPLKFTAGTNLTTAEAGTMEYDGENLYFSGEASQRGVVAASQFVILTSDYTTPLGTANVLKQAFNATTNGALTLTLGSYLFECLLNLSSLSATSGTIAFGFGGTALGRFRYLATANKTATSTTAANTTFSNTAAATIITPATTTTTGYALVQGSIVITTAGTIIPSIALSVAAANVVATGSYFNLTPIGSSTATTVGNWS